MSTPLGSDKVMVINCGSSSLKYQLVDPVSGNAAASGLVEQIGEPTGRVTHKQGGQRSEYTGEIPDHAQGLSLVGFMFTEAGMPLKDAGIAAFAHRYGHGGTLFRHPVVVTDVVAAELERLSDLAPLHNPANLMGILVAKEKYPDIPHVAVFDTQFYTTLPDAVTTYAIDADVAQKYGIRKYGFHGASHQYVSEQAAEFLGRPLADLNIITLHLGNGGSVTAVRGGEAVDTSLGMSTNCGVVMGTRCGDLDPGAIVELVRKADMDADQLQELLYRKSGLKGLCGDNDLRDIRRRREDGDAVAQLAHDVYVLSLRKYIGAYLVTLGRVDAIVFTAGIGENADDVRADALANLESLGIVLDADRNQSDERTARRISADESKVQVLVVPTNEELALAREAWKYV
jgi:acetate kinase